MCKIRTTEERAAGPVRPHLCSRSALIGLAAAIALLGSLHVSPAPARAASEANEALQALLERLTPQQRAEFDAYRKAQAAYETQASAFWSAVDEKRNLRRTKRRMGQPVEAGDYIAQFPPEYAGPALSPAIAAAWEELRKKDAPRPVPTLAEVLESAQAHYQFAPEAVDERGFKRRYAIEALNLGLTRDQVVRIYALETGGQGTYDMQAGISPITRQGKPISTALGYAQLLHANSVNEIVKHGPAFVLRLERMARIGGVDPARAVALKAKAQAVRLMVANARRVPNEWADHVRYAGTSEGLGIHALNLDADVGPWLQVLKLEGLRELAAKAGMPALTGAEIELMNLAGPATGLEMMQPAAHNAPTVNFFSRRGYEVNSVVKKRTARELLAELDRRMMVNLEKPGAKEFAAIFDEVAAARQARR